MNINRLIIGTCATLALMLGMSTANAAIQRVIIVQPSDLSSYLKEIDTLRGLFKKAGVTVTLRVWRATHAGNETGTIAVTEEVADMATLAKVEGLTVSNPDVAATMARIGKIRKIVSDSLYEGL